MPEWISVKDRLPKLPNAPYCDVLVIAAIKGNGRSTALFYERTTIRGKIVERWRYHYNRICDEEVTHWMPLPEPPKEGVGE